MRRPQFFRLISVYVGLRPYHLTYNNDQIRHGNIPGDGCVIWVRPAAGGGVPALPILGVPTTLSFDLERPDSAY